MIAEGINRIWLKHYDQEVSPNLDYETIPLYEILERSAARFPDRPAVVFNNWTVNYKRLKLLVDLASANLKKSGVRAGDRVAIMLPNCPQTVISYWACLKLGAVVVMTNPLYMEKELVHHFNDSEAKTLITLNLLWKRINGLRDKLRLKRIFVTSIADCELLLSDGTRLTPPITSRTTPGPVRKSCDSGVITTKSLSAGE